MRNKGFTLLEVLVATVIGAFVAATAVGTLRAVTASREKIASHIAAMSEIRFAGNLLRRDLNCIYRDKKAANVKLTGMPTGAEEEMTSVLTFLTVSRAQARPSYPEGDVCEVEYFLRQEDDQSALMRRLDPYPYKREEKGGIVCIVAENIIAFGVRFFDAKNNEWQTEWPEDALSLPQMVRVTLAARMPEQKNVVTDSFIISFPRWPQKNQNDKKPEGEL
ncbi:MAG: prepilin-type N-terminal cleavage/methylation domain-containing protein [Sedimentisphaerales bacterium]|nr:prepilin-type N-terminal cleavage/methylation domain-containing protein [Sedimentisphaerales bacterium]